MVNWFLNIVFNIVTISQLGLSTGKKIYFVFNLFYFDIIYNQNSPNLVELDYEVCW